jgi:DNA mismatch repair protein MutL
MAPIRALEPALVNKIAAGEVIERPASVVKELMENALDAGATRLEVEIVDGGSTLIRVTDNGAGIAPEELPLAVAPHATSKIATAEDLSRVATMGFRGEALASIAAVSRLRIVSRQGGMSASGGMAATGGMAAALGGHAPADAGAELTICDTEIESPKPIAAPPGTTVEVRNLFFNLPARRKFLRQPGTELAHVTEQIARIALAHPSVSIRQLHNGREVRLLPASQDRLGRISDFYGDQLAAELFSVSRQERELTIDALIAPPAIARVTPKWQYVFLNGRFIVDRFVRYAIREAFRGLMEPSRHPVVFLFLHADPSQFDVNVHPTKIEVRWRDAGLVQSQVLAVIRESLLSRDLTPRLIPSRNATDGEPHDRAEHVRAAIADFLLRAQPTQRPMEFQPTFPSRTVPSPARSGLPTVEDRADDSPPQIDESTPPPARLQPAAPAGRAIQIHNTYLVVESPEGVIIIDQHALHERILYEQFCERILKGDLESQRLLLPETLELSPQQLAAAEQHADLLRRIGIDISPFGPDALAVQGFPSFLHNVDIRAFLRDVLDRLAEPGRNEHPETLVHRLLDMMACKAAVKAGDPLTPEEIEALLAQRHLIDRSSNCPHGRPTTLRLTLHDLERQFKRT